jgi:hypothetical protein
LDNNIGRRNRLVVDLIENLSFDYSSLSRQGAWHQKQESQYSVHRHEENKS